MNRLAGRAICVQMSPSRLIIAKALGFGELTCTPMIVDDPVRENSETLAAETPGGTATESHPKTNANVAAINKKIGWRVGIKFIAAITRDTL